MDNRCHLPRRHPRHSTSSCHGISAYVADESPSKKKRSIDHATFLKKKRRKEYQIHRGIKKDRVSRSILRTTALSSWERILSCILVSRSKLCGEKCLAYHDLPFRGRILSSIVAPFFYNIELRSRPLFVTSIPYHREACSGFLIVTDFPSLKLYFRIYLGKEEGFFVFKLTHIIDIYRIFIRFLKDFVIIVIYRLYFELFALFVLYLH